MDSLKLYLKNMVSSRCQIVVKQVLGNLGVRYYAVTLDKAEIVETLSDWQLAEIKSALQPWGIELLYDKRVHLTDKIKDLLVELVNNSDQQIPKKLSMHLSEELNRLLPKTTHLSWVSGLNSAGAIIWSRTSMET